MWFLGWGKPKKDKIETQVSKEIEEIARKEALEKAKSDLIEVDSRAINLYEKRLRTLNFYLLHATEYKIDNYVVRYRPPPAMKPWICFQVDKEGKETCVGTFYDIGEMMRDKGYNIENFKIVKKKRNWV